MGQYESGETIAVVGLDRATLFFYSEGCMELQVKGDGTGFEIHLKGTWRRTKALLIAIGLLVPVIVQLGSLLGIY